MGNNDDTHPQQNTYSIQANTFSIHLPSVIKSHFTKDKTEIGLCVSHLMLCNKAPQNLAASN